MFRRKLYDARVTELARVDMPDWIRALAASQPLGVSLLAVEGANGVNLNPLVLS